MTYTDYLKEQARLDKKREELMERLRRLAGEVRDV
jgi:hypothetical protein